MAIKWVPVVRTLHGISPSPNTSTGPTLSLMKGRADIFLETRFLAGVKEKEHVFPFLLCAGISPDSSQWKLKVMMQFWGTEILPTREVERGYSVLTQPLRVFSSNSSLKYSFFRETSNLELNLPHDVDTLSFKLFPIFSLLHLVILVATWLKNPPLQC